METYMFIAVIVFGERHVRMGSLFIIINILDSSLIVCYSLERLNDSGIDVLAKNPRKLRVLNKRKNY